MVAAVGAEDDGLLRGAAGLQKVVEKVAAHGQDAVREQETGLVFGHLIGFGQVVARGKLSGDGVDGGQGHDLFGGKAGFVEIDAAPLDLACGEIAVFHGLGEFLETHYGSVTVAYAHGGN